MLLVVLILILAAILGVFGTVLKGMLWLLILGLILLVVGAVLGAINIRNRP